MIKPLIAVAIAAVTLTGCANNSTLSGDVFSASEARQVQTVTYGTLLSVRPVTIQGGDENNVRVPLAGLSWVVSLGILLAVVPVVVWRQPQVRLLVVWRGKVFRAQ
ncbi:outer membrane lipoprotein [Yersinia intermedia]|nr:outer membrane lipoprotein [Yersinia intermedia]